MHLDTLIRKTRKGECGLRQLNNWIDSYLEFTSESEAPEPFHLWSALWGISAAVERKVWLDQGYFTLYPNMFVVLTGPPASRKTTASNIMKNILEEGEVLGENPDMTSKEALLQELGNSTKTFELKGENVRHCSMSLVSSEWSTFMGDKDMDMCNTLCKLYDCDSKFNKWTKTQGRDKIVNTFLSLLGCSTATQIGDCLPYKAVGGGLTSRIIFVVEGEQKERRNSRPSISKEKKALREKLVNDIRHINTLSGEFEWSDMGGQWFDDWYVNRDEKIKSDSKFEHYSDRKPVHLVKMAMLLSIAESDELVVHRRHLERALEMLNEAEIRMPEALGGVGMSLSAPVVSKVMQLIKEHKEITQKELQGYLWRDANRTELISALETVLDMSEHVSRKADGKFVWEEKDASRKA